MKSNERKQDTGDTKVSMSFLFIYLFRVEIASVETVPSFGPPLPDGGVFFDDSELQSFLLAKRKTLAQCSFFFFFVIFIFTYNIYIYILTFVLHLPFLFICSD